jgi:indole-3-glycerol phosphate synthase
MTENILKKLVNNSQSAIDNDVYAVKVNANINKSSMDFLQMIKSNIHATLLTEIKFSSPSLGKIRTISDPVSIAKQMIAGGSKALSVLTQPYLFNGSPEYFIQVRQAVDVPLLMKDVMIDKVQIDLAQKIGADYILIIQSLFEQGFLKDIDEFIEYGHKKGLKILLEVHTKQEFQNALKTGADLIGINNRNLDTMEIDLRTTEIILREYKKTRPILSESGIETPEDIQYLKRCGADAFLIGSSIMKSDDIEEHVRKLVRAY